MTAAKQVWTEESVQAIYTKPLMDLLFEAQTIHRMHHNPNQLQVATLLSIKTGACPENCGYCSQSGHFKTSVEKESLMSVDEVLALAQQAKDNGATRFCMGAAWRSPPDKVMPQLQQMIEGVKSLGLETCMTLGMLSKTQAQQLKGAGLDFYNHNIDTSPSYYEQVVTTRQFSDRLDTLEVVREAGMHVCCGGILGLGETQADRIEFIMTLANLEIPPESIPINQLMRMSGTPLSNAKPLDPFEIVRTIATLRIIIPASKIRLTAGRTEMSDELQAMCFFAGGNSVFIGDKLLTADNPAYEKDKRLFSNLGIEALPA